MRAGPRIEAKRIVLANEPRLFRDMLQRALEGIPGLEVVAQVADTEDLWHALEQSRAEWIVVSLTPGGKLPAVTEVLLIRYPSLCILGVAADGSRAQIRGHGFPAKEWSGGSLDELVELLQAHSPAQATVERWN